MISIPYVDRHVHADIPQPNLLFDVEPRDVAPATDPVAIIRSALANPIGTQPLRALLRAGQKVIITSDDITRATPTKQIVPIILDELNGPLTRALPLPWLWPCVARRFSGFRRPAAGSGPGPAHRHPAPGR